MSTNIIVSINVYSLTTCPVVDSLQATEIVVSFSSLSRWPEPPPLVVEEKKSHTSLKGGKDKIDDKEITNMTSSSVLDGRSHITN